MKTISIIRQRGQLTIPESIRRAVNWISPLSAVSVSFVKPDEIIIRPHQQKVDWDKVWESIKKSRSIKGKGKISASAFLEKDRQIHK